MLLIAIGLVVLLGVVRACDKTGAPSVGTYAADSTSGADTASATVLPVPQDHPIAPPAGSQWSYNIIADPMSGKTEYTATVQSSNTLSLDFPYNGEQHGTLTLRSHPKFGKDVILTIEKGQVLCRSYEDCAIGVRFDDASPTNWNGAGAADGSTETVFIRNYGNFASHVKKSQRVRISIPLYQAGEQMLEFDVSGFDQSQMMGSRGDAK